MKWELRKIPLTYAVITRLKNWPEYLLHVLGWLKHPFVIYKLKNGLSYYVRTNTIDRGIFNAIALENEYQIDNLALPDQATVIDLGGQNGYFPLTIAGRVGQVLVYEPVWDNYQNILINIAINHLDQKIKPFNLAISDHGGLVKIYLSDTNSGGHSIYQNEKLAHGGHIIINSVTLPEIFINNQLDHCDLLKLDIEGAEYDILYNLPDAYFSKITNICLETHDIDQEKHNQQSLIQFLQNKDYQITSKGVMVLARK